MKVEKYEEHEGGDDRPLGKYVLFAGLDFYPSEGVTDLRASGDDGDELVAEGKRITDERYQWWQVAETATLKIIVQSEGIA